MLITFDYNHKTYQADLSQPIDISIPLRFNQLDNPNAWYCPMPEEEPQRYDKWIIAVSEGASVNSFGLRLFPHGNGTHTEGVGHISLRNNSNTIHQVLTTFHSMARLISVYPTRTESGDRIIFKEQIKESFDESDAKTLIIRTLPNDNIKKSISWSGINPPYVDAEAMAYIVECGVRHLLIDTPSVDREDDGGKVMAHRIFWKGKRAADCTITEMIYVADHIKDGLYLLNLQIPSFESDAAPSKPVLYFLK